MLLRDKRTYVVEVPLGSAAKSSRRRRNSHIVSSTGEAAADAAMEVVLTADNNHTLLGTLVLEDARLMATPSPADTSPIPRDYDDRGATMYAVAVILVYGFSIVLLIASHTYMKRKNGKRGEGDTDMSTVNKYLEQVPHLQEISRKDSFRRLKMSIIPMVSIAVGRDITELPSKPDPPTPPRSPIATLIHSIHDKFGNFSTPPTSPTSPTPKSVRFDFNNEGGPFGTSTYTPLLRSLSHRSETSGGGRDGDTGGVRAGTSGGGSDGDTGGVRAGTSGGGRDRDTGGVRAGTSGGGRDGDIKDPPAHAGRGAGEGGGRVGIEGQISDKDIPVDRQITGVSHDEGTGGGTGGTVAGVRHLGTAAGGTEDSMRKVSDPGAQVTPDIGVKLPAVVPYVRLLSTSSGISTVSAYTDPSSPYSPYSPYSPSSTTSSFPYSPSSTTSSFPYSPSSTTSSFPYNLADSSSSGVASDLQASSGSTRLWWGDGELLTPPSATARQHSPVAALPGVHQPKLLLQAPVQEGPHPGLLPPGARCSNYPQSHVVQVGGAAQGEEVGEEPLVPLQITTV